MHGSWSRALAALAIGRALAASSPAAAEGWFDLRRYETMKRSERAELELVLQAMYEATFYAQSAVGKPVICASPVPVPGARLIELVDAEVDKPTNQLRTVYTPSDHVAFVLLNALKAGGMCR